MTWNDLPRDPSSATLRRFAALCLLVFGGLGLWHLPATRGQVMLALGVGLGLPGLAWPALLRPVFVGWLFAVFPVGWLASRLALAIVYFGAITPLALWLRLRGRDALGLRGRAETYWTPHDAPDAASYYRQY